jgi:hypothetical protein
MFFLTIRVWFLLFFSVFITSGKAGTDDDSTCEDDGYEDIRCYFVYGNATYDATFESVCCYTCETSIIPRAKEIKGDGQSYYVKSNFGCGICASHSDCGYG